MWQVSNKCSCCYLLFLLLSSLEHKIGHMGKEKWTVKPWKERFQNIKTSYLGVGEDYR